MPPPNRPHSLSPSRETARVAFAYKNFAASKGISHTGLGVSCAMKAAVLWAHGIHTEVWPVSRPEDIEAEIVADAADGRHAPVSHVVIAAPWVPTDFLRRLVHMHRHIRFAVICHSDVGFLSADPGSIQRLHEMAGLAKFAHNFTMAGNNERFVRWGREAIQRDFRFLPNLYDVLTFEHPYRPPLHGRGSIRAGCYGAVRPLKNHITAAAAALQLSRERRIDVDFHVSSGRSEGGADLAPIRQMLSGSRCRLVEDAWRPWPEFRKLVGSMDLLLQPSYTESFNVVTADGIAEGVPSAVGETIDWVPPNWICRPDDAYDLAKTAMALMDDPHSARDGQHALGTYVSKGLGTWVDFLMSG